jgi:putative tricarboxylic transport membrane protein
LFGALGYVMLQLRLESAPLLLGFVLGPLMEEYLRRALILSRGDLLVFVHSPISAVFLAITAALLLWGAWTTVRGSIGRRAMASEGR